MRAVKTASEAIAVEIVELLDGIGVHPAVDRPPVLHRCRQCGIPRRTSCASYAVRMTAYDEPCVLSSLPADLVPRTLEPDSFTANTPTAQFGGDLVAALATMHKRHPKHV